MPYCVMCGSRIPEDQGSRTCSMCYGDIDHGKDSYYRRWAEEQDAHYQREQEREPEPEPDNEGNGR